MTWHDELMATYGAEPLATGNISRQRGPQCSSESYFNSIGQKKREKNGSSKIGLPTQAEQPKM